VKKQTIVLDELTERRTEIARLLAQHRRTAGGTLTDEARRWLEREQKHYRDENGDLSTWAAMRARIEKAFALAESRIAEAKAAEDAARAADTAKAAELTAAHDEALRGKIAYEVDPVTQWKRAHAARTW